ncbi:hypothetical protein [Chromobacterium phragmitis]|uniref:ESPR domain-containing protein n=1 Tax=Chromobacterium phragmitis TaxID=2202141 RepID=A0ABV0ITX5_9NEIS
MAEVDGGIISEQVNSVKLLKIYSIFLFICIERGALGGKYRFATVKTRRESRARLLGKAVRRLIFLGVWEDLMRLI